MELVLAKRLADGSIQLSDGRIVYADSVLQAADVVEIVPLLAPPPAWPFISGGGGGGAASSDGDDGVQGSQGNQGISGAAGGSQGFQGPQGSQGRQGSQGNQGAVGAGVQGPQGNQGGQGSQGISGAVAVGFQYDADTTSTTDSDPGPGDIKWNNASQASASEIYVDDVDKNSTDLSAFYAALSLGDRFRIQAQDDASQYQDWVIDSVTDQTGYFKFGVTLIGSAGGNFSNNQDILLDIAYENSKVRLRLMVITCAVLTLGST